MVSTLIHAKNRFLSFYQKNEVMVSAAVFAAGFVFDLLTLGRVDDLFNLTQQAIYLMILGTLLIYEIKIKLGTLTLGEKLARFWQYHDLVVHFLFGSLLSAYTIFYYTSASALTSLAFITLLAGLMLANEIPRIQKLGLPVRVILFNICLLSYCAFLYPILMGHVGVVPFWLGLLTSVAILWGVWKINFKSLGFPTLLKRHVLTPALGVHLFFVLGYYFSLIPPVPVAVKKIGIYYNVTKVEDKYLGQHLKPFWRFWDHGSQQFYTRDGDKVMVLLSIFSPGRFEDQVFLKWYFHDPKLGWHLEDTIPLSILGGRDEGFRGYGSKQFYAYGDWRIIVETSDQREVGRIALTIMKDPSLDERIFEVDAF